VTTRSPRELAQDVLDSGYPERILAIAEDYTPRFSRRQARRTATAVKAELDDLGIDCPASSVTDLTLLQQVTVPVADDALALAVARLFVCAAVIDDVSGYDSKLPFSVLGDCAPHQARSSPYATCVDRMFEGIAGFCDSRFLGVLKGFYHRSLIGVLLEQEFSTDGTDQIDTEYVRRASGFAEFWSATLQFVDPSLEFCGNVGFWAGALHPMVDFLNEFNDVLSFYKEALDGRDLISSKPYRAALRKGIPYLDAYRQALDLATRSYRQILDLADDKQRPYLDNYMKGYIYWHTHTARYRWKDILPAIHLMDINDGTDQALCGGGYARPAVAARLIFRQDCFPTDDRHAVLNII
jgi:Trichodiene synthase (TRI5)